MKSNIKTKTKYKLRPYQKDCVRIVNDITQGRHMVYVATGLGKTVIASRFKCDGRILFLSHRDELVRQPEKYFKDVGKTFGIEKAEEHSHGEQVVSASVQSICKDERLHCFKPDDFELIIVDEAHHAAVPTYRKILNYFSGAKKVIGLTATVQRGDKVRLDDVFDDIVFARDIKWGIKNRWLAPIHAVRATASYSLKNVKKSKDDFNLRDLERELQQEESVMDTAKAYVENCHEKGKQTLLYCLNITICKMVMAAIKGMIGENEKNTI